MSKGIVWAAVIAVGLSIFLPLEGMARKPREPLLHAMASFVLPGLGQYLNDEPDKALAHFLVAVAIPIVCPIIAPIYEWRWRLCALLQLGWHAYSAIDAYEVAKRLNRQHAFTFAPPQPTLGLEGGREAYAVNTVASFSHPVFATSLTLAGQSFNQTCLRKPG